MSIIERSKNHISNFFRNRDTTMSIKEKIACSSDVTMFTLFKEGRFFKCYNEDAMVFVNKIKPYKVSAKFVKNIGEIVYSIGFPVRENAKNGTGIDFEAISEKLLASHYEAKDKRVVFYLGDKSVKDDYAGWINNIQSIVMLSVSEEPTSADQKITLDTLHRMIKEYDLANNTPIQGLNFIQELKAELTKREKNNGNI